MALPLAASSPCLSSRPSSGITFWSSQTPSPFNIRVVARVSSSTRIAAIATGKREEDGTSLEKISELPEGGYDEAGFVEVGVVISKHGVRGELLVRSSTDFPQQRFEKPGKRWMRMSSRGQQKVEVVELVSGRNRAGKLPCWLLTFKGVDTVEKATNYIGATMLVKREERPALEEGEFYIPDLIGMEVFVQSSMENIGVIADMCNFGASDLLRVQRNPTSSVGEGPLIWIPFVEAIVPEVDLERRRVMVSPPEGLLELNAPAKREEKAEARKEELREKRKLQVRKSGLKKSLLRCRQDHLLAGLLVGEQEERKMLLEELLKIDFKSLQESFIKAHDRSKRNDCRLNGFTQLPEVQTVSKQELQRWIQGSSINKDTEKMWWKQGLDLIACNRVVVACLVRSAGNDLQALEKSRLQFYARQIRETEKQAILEFPGHICQIPWFICTSTDLVDPIRSLLEKEEFFGLQQTQVCVLAVESNPCFDVNTVDGHHQILRSSPWKLVQSVSGHGGILNVLAAEGLVTELHEKGVDYIHVLDDPTSETMIGDPIFFGFADSQKSDLCIQVVDLQPSMDVIGFKEFREDDRTNYELVSRYKSRENKELELRNASSPRGSYVLSIAFVKKLQVEGFNFELHTAISSWTEPIYREKDGKCEMVESNAIFLESSLLDCIVKCEANKVSLLKVS